MNRRTLLGGLLASSSIATTTNWFSPARAEAAPLKLSVVSRTIEVNGKSASVYGFAGEGGKNLLSLPANETTLVELTNGLSEETMVHWHGLTPQWQFDGVPDLPAPLLKAGETRRYELPGGAGGTHWMHAHTLQEQGMLAAPLIVHDAEAKLVDEQEVVILLHDFSFTPATELLAKLKSSSGMGGVKMHSMGNMQGMQGMSHMDIAGGMSHMKMMGMDLNDIDYDAYLANDRTLRDPQVTKVEKGGRVRLRLINGATATAFLIDTGTLAGTIVAVDGQDIVPLSAKRIPLTMGQRVDVLLPIPKEGGVFPILALREGGLERTGIVLSTFGANVSKLSEMSAAKTQQLDLNTELQMMARNPLSAKKPDHEFLVGLIGSMQGYAWNLTSDKPLVVSEGTRVQIEMRNMSMMAHPMHLHGHHFQVVAINGTPFLGAVRDTVLLPPMASVTVAFNANNPGKAWAYHCHNLYHMASGMMTTLAYQGV